MEQLDDLLAGVGVRLSDEILDRIDEIVPPGADVGAPGQSAYLPPAPPALEPPPPTPRRTRRSMTPSSIPPRAEERGITCGVAQFSWVARPTGSRCGLPGSGYA